jgi:hypothetical protein
MLLLRRAWPDDPRRADYQVFDGAMAIGRMYETTVPGGRQWLWTVYGLAIKDESVPGGLADSRGDAMAAFKAAWERCEPRDVGEQCADVARGIGNAPTT